MTPKSPQRFPPRFPPGFPPQHFPLRALGETIARARQCSRFYRDHFRHLPQDPVADMAQFQALPCTFPRDLRESPQAFQAVSRDEIRRIVTLHTSGTTAPPKRLFFTAKDLGRTIDYFIRELSQLIFPGETGLILLPGETPGGAGDLLKTAMGRLGVHGVVHGIITGFDALADRFFKHRPTLLIGLPVQVLAFCELLTQRKKTAGFVRNVILTSDYLSPAVKQRIQTGLDCRVFDHYGMTETGFGGGIDCINHQGYHLRETDLFYEIVDPDRGRPLPDGEWGEVTFTTLTRTGMPLVRYRTGDISRMLPGPCPCRSPFRRMDYIRGRSARSLVLPGALRLGMPDLDDLFFRFPGVMDFTASVTDRSSGPGIGIRLKTIEPLTPGDISRYTDRYLYLSPALERALGKGTLELGPVTCGPFRFTDTYTGKRQIEMDDIQ